MSKTGIIALVAVCLSIISLPNAQSQEASKPAVTANKVDGIELPADQTVDPNGGFVTIEAKTDGDVKWLVLGTVPVKYTVFGRLVVVGTPPGATIQVYAVTALVQEEKAVPSDFARTIITVSGNKPVDPNIEPGPGPGPGPDPEPITSGKFHVTIVEDPLKRTPLIASIIQSPALRDTIRKWEYPFRVYNVRDEDIDRSKLRKYITDAGVLPVLVVQDETGRVVGGKSHPLPASIADVLNLIKQLTGRE